MIRKVIPLLIVALILVSNSCKKDDPVITTEPRADDISIFIWAGMYDYYLWYDKIDKLSEVYLSDLDSWYRYLNGFDSDYDALFEDLLYPLDIQKGWSWLIEDWEEQEKQFSGISTSMGYDFRLVRFYNSDDIFGYVRYVLPGSPAEQAGLARGDLFTKVDGQILTIYNYISLLFDQDSYELSLAHFSDPSTISLTGETASMTAVELQENPVFLAEVLDIGDGLKTGYLVYNSFTSDFDMELNEAFGSFKNQAIDRLILDLRYNGGGSTRSAVHLASMIHSVDPSLVFAQSQFNYKFHLAYVDYYGEDSVLDYFTGSLDTTTYNHDPQLPDINSLGLNDIYIIGTGSTASASEMIINGLDPYMNVVQVGDTTFGKYVGSFTIYDNYTTGSRNTEHKYALQPITFKISNSEGVSDYPEGLIPDVAIEEDIRDLGTLGDPTEPLLAAAISNILGTTKTAVRSGSQYPGFKGIADSKDSNPFSKDMYIRYPKFEIRDFLTFEK